MKKIIIGLIVLTISFILFYGYFENLNINSTPNISGGCSKIGCHDYITLSSINPLPELLTIYGNNDLLLDMCDPKNIGLTLSNHFEDDKYTTYIIISNEDLSNYNFLRIYSKESCDSIEKLLYEVDDSNILYETLQPNGPWCEPTCYFAEIMLD